MTGPHGEPWEEFETKSVEGLAPPFDDLLLNLLTYKRLFVGPWFDRIGGDAATRLLLAAIREATLVQAVGAVESVHAWRRFPAPADPAEAAAAWTGQRILHDLLAMKESSTEVFLNAAVHAPTDELRQRILQLADEDRTHAEELRRVLGGRSEPSIGNRAVAEAATDVGAAAGRREEGSLRRSVERDIEHLRAHGAEPVRLVVSDVALRHLRDEQAVDMDRGLALGLPVAVDFAWSGECYALETRERLTLAEIITRTRGR